LKLKWNRTCKYCGIKVSSYVLMIKPDWSLFIGTYWRTDPW
jgi:hypothetical protein